MIQRYGDGGFRIAGVGYESSVIVLPDETLPWQVSNYEDISAGGLAQLMGDGNGVEMLLIGCGPRMRMPRTDIYTALKAFSIVPEWMDTGAACRTFNVLLSENRAVAAALIAVE